MTAREREKTIVRTSLLGIGTNIALSALKAVVGLLSHSIAIVLDAVNNLTDALSSLVTIIGTKLAEKPADREHPFGHGRAEYLSALVIAVIILYAGVTSLVESVKKIFAPTTPAYSAATIALVAVAVAVKIALGLFVKATGKRVHSDSLTASGQDALLDAVISVSTLVAAAVFLWWHVALEAYLGVGISFAIIAAGVQTVRETLSKILGERLNADIARAIKATVRAADPEIHGVFDLVLNNYGPDRHIGSVHIEVPDTWTADKIDAISRKITADVYERHQVALAAIGVYSVNVKDDSVARVRAQVENIVREHKSILQMHGFYLNEEKKQMRFDIIVSFDAPNMQSMFDHVVADVREAFPDYDVQVQFDTDICD